MKQERRRFLITLASMGTTDVFGQRATPKARRVSKYRLKGSLPAIYLSVVKIEKKESLDSKGEEETYVWFKLHNNTIWPIWTDASVVPKEYGNVALYYVIEDYEKGERVTDNRPHVSSSIPLPSGRAWVFVVPLKEFEENCQIRINFSFDWENRDDVFAGREAEHSVCFMTSQLPKKKTP